MTNHPTEALARVCNALWLATLSLMTAYLGTRAPAHRYLLARRIANNLETLRHEACFSVESRASFTRLAQRWTARADPVAIRQELAPQLDLSRHLKVR